MTDADGSAILKTIAKAFHNAFGTEAGKITIDALPDDIEGWDSLGHAVLASELEAVFEVSFDIDDLMEMENVKAIVDVLTRKHGVTG